MLFSTKKINKYKLKRRASVAEANKDDSARSQVREKTKLAKKKNNIK